MTRSTPLPDTAAGKPSTGSQPASVGTSPVAPGSARPEDGERLGMPHERDESTGDTSTEPHAPMKQAKKDLDAGQVDTDLHNTGGVDEALRDDLLKRER